MAATGHVMRAGGKSALKVLASSHMPRLPSSASQLRNLGVRQVGSHSRWAAALHAQQQGRLRGLHSDHKPAARSSQVGRLGAIVASSERAHPDKPKDQNGNPRGEDACFHTSGNGASGKWTVCGIADGVGGWSSEGIDAGEYARELMGHAKAACVHDNLRADPKALLNKAHTDMDKFTQGSCTAVIAVLEHNMLRLANLGDSGVIGYRSHQAHPFLRTKEQQHRFNCPLQLGSGGGGDEAKDADFQEHPVQHNDIVVLATDGFWDNLYDRDILALIRDFVAKDEQLSLLPKGHASTNINSSSYGQAASITSASASASAAVPSVQQRAGMHTTADLAASLGAPRVLASMSAELADSKLHERAFPDAPAMQAAGPVEKGFLSRGLASLAPAVPAAAAWPTHSLSWQSLQQLAERLVQEAHKKALGTASTPFSEAAARARKRYQGGKLDDITVVVAQVQMQSQEDDKISTASTAAI